MPGIADYKPGQRTGAENDRAASPDRLHGVFAEIQQSLDQQVIVTDGLR
jgi:hypothetical protein